MLIRFLDEKLNDTFIKVAEIQPVLFDEADGVKCTLYVHFNKKMNCQWDGLTKSTKVGVFYMKNDTDVLDANLNVVGVVE